MSTERERKAEEHIEQMRILPEITGEDARRESFKEGWDAAIEHSKSVTVKDCPELSNVIIQPGRIVQRHEPKPDDSQNEGYYTPSGKKTEPQPEKSNEERAKEIIRTLDEWSYEGSEFRRCVGLVASALAQVRSEAYEAAAKVRWDVEASFNTIKLTHYECECPTAEECARLGDSWMCIKCLCDEGLKAIRSLGRGEQKAGEEK